jgi:high affinity Mn2+ porin
MRRHPIGAALAASLVLATAAPNLAEAADDAALGTGEAETWSLHGQLTNVTQYHPPFRSPIRGPNSLDPGHRGNETVDATLYAGVRLWGGAAFYANPEIDQGFGLSNTLGVAGFPSGEAYKVGSAYPYVRLHRAFLRVNRELGGDAQRIEPDKNQLAGSTTADNLVLTLGKFAVTDVFDTNAYAHDPRADFLNWSIIDAGAFDYAADAWGYTYGAAAEWTQSWWTLRGGLFDLSRVPNSKRLERGFGQYSIIAELEARHHLLGPDGKAKLLLWVNRGRMADYADAVRAAAGTDAPPDVATVRRYRSRPGLALNFEQQIVPELGAFLRASLDDGHKETYEFTEINRSVAGGVAWKGERWSRPDDTVGLAGVVNAISRDARAYLAAGGLGILIGDGELRRYGTERIIETYYSATVVSGVALTADYQYVTNPAYNRDRGPVSIFGLRVHAEF